MSRTLRHEKVDVVLSADGFACLDADAKEYFDERAAIYEYLAHYPRSEAERMAWEEVRRYLEGRQ